MLRLIPTIVPSRYEDKSDNDKGLVYDTNKEIKDLVELASSEDSSVFKVLFDMFRLVMIIDCRYADARTVDAEDQLEQTREALGIKEFLSELEGCGDNVEYIKDVIAQRFETMLGICDEDRIPSGRELLERGQEEEADYWSRIERGK